MSCFLGIDSGTSGVKAIVLDETGKVHGVGYKECDLITPKPGWVEQNPLDWWEACSGAIKQAVRSSGRGADIAGIGFSGQMQGSTLMDKDMQPIGNCMIWLDQRATAECQEIESKISAQEMLSITVSYCLPSFWAPKLLWLKKHKPADFAKIHKVLFTKDYLRFMLTGEIATEVSDASLTFLMDVPKRQWSQRMFEVCGLPRELVPERLVESQEVVGNLKPALAEKWGLKPGIPVVAGGGDQPAGAVGNGTVKAGIVSATIGTSGVVFGCADSPIIDSKKRASFSLCHSVPEKWCFLGCTLAAGGSFKWLRETFFAEKKLALAEKGLDVYEYMTELAGKAPASAEGLLFLPYLGGEATPIADPNARGTFFGLSYRHSAEHICRSVMEGVTYSLRETIEILREFGTNVTEVRASGGGAKSALWRQMQADIYGATVVTMNMEEGPAAGAAILAAVGAGCFASIQEGCEAILKPVSYTEPIPANVAMYEEYYAAYRSLYQTLKNSFEKQAGLVAKYTV